MKISLALASTAISGSSSATCLRGEKEERHAGQAGHRTVGMSHHQSFSTGTLPEHAGLHLAVSFALFLLPFADLAQGLFDPIARDLRLFLILFLLVGLLRLFLLLLFLIFLLLVLLLAIVLLLVFLLLVVLLLILLILLLLVLFLLVLVLLFLILLILSGLRFLNFFENLTRLLGRRIGSLRILLLERFDRPFHLLDGSRRQLDRLLITSLDQLGIDRFWLGGPASLRIVLSGG